MSRGVMIMIILWIFITFGTIMGSLCLFHGVRKIINGETDFRVGRLLKMMNKYKGTIDDFSGMEILFIGFFLIACSIAFYYLVV